MSHVYRSGRTCFDILISVCMSKHPRMSVALSRRDHRSLAHVSKSCIFCAAAVKPTFVFGLFLLLFLFFFLSSRRCSLLSASRSSYRCSSSIGIGVGNAVLELMNGIPLIVDWNGSRNNLLV